MQIVGYLAHGRRRLTADPSARLRRVEALPADRSACLELLASVDDPSLQVARAALRRLVSLGGAEEGALLGERLLDVDIGLVPDCARALARLDRPTGASVAAKGLHSPSPHTRQAAAIALVELAWPEARGELEQLLADDAGFVRRAAVDALAALDARPSTTGLLLERLDDCDVGVRIAAVVALAQLSPSPSEALQQTVDDPDRRVRLALSREAARLSNPILERLLLDPDEDVRVEVLWRLLATPRNELADAIHARLLDPRGRVRRTACRALAPLRDAEADHALVERLGDSDPVVRAAALRTLRQRRPDDAARFLAGQVGHVDSLLRPTLLYAIARIDGDAADACVRALDLVHDDSVHVRFAVADTCLARSRDLLAQLALDDDLGVRHAARSRLQSDA